MLKLLMFCVLLLLFSQGICFSQEVPKGFGGLYWGATMKQVDSLLKKEQLEKLSGFPKEAYGTTVYMCVRDFIGSPGLTSYIFKNKKMVGGAFSYAGPDSSFYASGERILTALVGVYGEPHTIRDSNNRIFSPDEVEEFKRTRLSYSQIKYVWDFPDTSQIIITFTPKIEAMIVRGMVYQPDRLMVSYRTKDLMDIPPSSDPVRNRGADY